MNWAQACNQNQSGQVNSHYENQRAYGAETGGKQSAMFIGQAIADQATGPLNIHGDFQPEQVADVPQLIEARTRHDKQNDPRDSGHHTQLRMK